MTILQKVLVTLKSTQTLFNLIAAPCHIFINFSYMCLQCVVLAGKQESHLHKVIRLCLRIQKFQIFII